MDCGLPIADKRRVRGPGATSIGTAGDDAGYEKGCEKEIEAPANAVPDHEEKKHDGRDPEIDRRLTSRGKYLAAQLGRADEGTPSTFALDRKDIEARHVVAVASSYNQ